MLEFPALPAVDECHSNIPSTPSLVGFVYNCPGKDEAESEDKSPCWGDTGDYLDIGLDHLNTLRPDLFPELDRYAYLITNVWSQVEHKGTRRKRTSADLDEIAARQNIDRLFAQIKNQRYIVACGRRAQFGVRLCVEYLELPAKVAYVQHTSFFGMGKQKQSEIRRVMLAWAKDVLDQFGESF